MADCRLPVISILRLAREAPSSIPYGVRMIGAELEWGETRGSGVKIGVLDTGVPDHPDLRVTAAADFTGSGAADRHGHATHCCGIMAANGLIKGVAPEAELYTAKVLNDKGQGDWRDLISGLRWCREQGVDIINLSPGGTRAPAELHDEIRKCLDAGILIIAAAGNRAGEKVYPAAYPEVLAVAAVDAKKQAGRGRPVMPEAELVSFGAETYSTYLSGRYALLTGTGLAAPHICGAAAILQGKALIRFGRRLAPRDLSLLLSMYAQDLGEIRQHPPCGCGVFSFARLTGGEGSKNLW